MIGENSDLPSEDVRFMQIVGGVDFSGDRSDVSESANTSDVANAKTGGVRSILRNIGKGAIGFGVTMVTVDALAGYLQEAEGLSRMGIEGGIVAFGGAVLWAVTAEGDNASRSEEA